MKIKGRFVIGALALVVSLGCEMEEQPKHKPYDRSSFFSDGSTARPPIPQTVAVGALAESRLIPADLNSQTFPFAVALSEIKEGQRSYGVFCAPCHGFTGDGNGAVVKRGFPAPPSFHSEPQRALTRAHVFEVIYSGYRSSPAFKGSLSARETWEIVAYLSALQKSQNAGLDAAPADKKAELLR